MFVQGEKFLWEHAPTIINCICGVVQRQWCAAFFFREVGTVVRVTKSSSVVTFSLPGETLKKSKVSLRYLHLHQLLLLLVPFCFYRNQGIWGSCCSQSCCHGNRLTSWFWWEGIHISGCICGGIIIMNLVVTNPVAMVIRQERSLVSRCLWHYGRVLSVVWLCVYGNSFESCDIESWVLPHIFAAATRECCSLIWAAFRRLQPIIWILTDSSKVLQHCTFRELVTMTTGGGCGRSFLMTRMVWAVCTERIGWPGLGVDGVLRLGNWNKKFGTLKYNSNHHAETPSESALLFASVWKQSSCCSSLSMFYKSISLPAVLPYQCSISQSVFLLFFLINVL